MGKTMKTKAIEILIAAAVVAVLFGVVFCFVGCKDKAEAEEWITNLNDPNAIITIWDEVNEPEYYHPLVDSRAYTCPKCYSGATGNLCPGHYEPDDTIYFDSESFEIVPNSIAPTSEGTVWFESDEIPPPSIFYYDGEKKIEYIPKPEPNEPMKYSLPIPTWPEYIELEKDLVIDITGRDEEPGIKKWWFGKGTKIYFKD